MIEEQAMVEILGMTATTLVSTHSSEQGRTK